MISEVDQRMSFARELDLPIMTTYKRDWFKRISAYGLVQLENPGAGKDGFLLVDCLKDVMYEHGDRFGSNKFQYKMMRVSNSSIVHYDDIIPREDRARMTPEVCFEFCRDTTMGFFGINNGRDCYCTPFYKAIASDSSMCDSVCEGDDGQMCGGPSKSSIFVMHSCGSTGRELEKAVESGENVGRHMESLCGSMKNVSDSVTHAAQNMQQVFGRIGDPKASNQMQLANEHAGEWLHEAEKCLDLAASVKSLVEDASNNVGKDFTQYDDRKAAEDHISKLEGAAKEGTEMLAGHVKGWQAVQPSLGSAAQQANTFLPSVLDQYYSIMYFIDKEYADDEKFPVTCDGDLIGEPALGLDAQRCAAACEHVGDCVGFAAYQDGDSVLCFLFSKFKTAQYYTGCESSSNTGFLQKKRDHRDAIASWAVRHKHAVHVNFTSEDKAACALKRRSATCKASRESISPDGQEGTACYLKPNNLWSFEDLPGYFACLGACCEDYDSNLMLDPITCQDILGFYPTPPADVCAGPLQVMNPPPGTKVETICPVTCNKCDGPVTTSSTTTQAPLVSTVAPVVIVSPTNNQPGLNSEIKAMCRGKFSKIGTASLKPDPSGKSKFALKELTKADRCFD